MSMHDDGYGRKAGPDPGSQSDFANRQGAGNAPGVQTWGNNALNAQTERGNLHGSRSGKAGSAGQRTAPDFGGGSSVFAQMPTYTPVTRGPSLARRLRSRRSFLQPVSARARPCSRASRPRQAELPEPAVAVPAELSKSSPAAAPSYRARIRALRRAIRTPSRAAAGLSPTSTAATPGYQAADLAASLSAPPISRRALRASRRRASGSQAYPAPSYNGAQGFPSQSFAESELRRCELPRTRNSGDASFPETSFDQNFADANFGNQGFAKQSFGDASFPEPQNFDASFPDTSFPAGPAFGHQEHRGHDSMGGYAQADGQAEQSFESFADETAQDYGSGKSRRAILAGSCRPSTPFTTSRRRSRLGSNDQTRRAAQDFYEGERVDADFLDEGQVAPAARRARQAGMTFKGRSVFMVGSALLGAIALGGALAFAYKQSGGGLGSEAAASGPGRQPARQGAARPARRQGISAQEQADLRPADQRR